ncbi:hypothetical protein R8871_04009 [Paraburkholderia graminis C4D1M]|jgi:hypothetical protein|uniref:Uncharacterized protein n=1 Tax=Paraburkholderia graminis (strain ATCC 700544 / DSM 17151 / LMG 18924 / NCIMB 13744 / C4D1M) TaxID=396598 RepID=B1G6R8_PARG4|nr:hypothetical protein BgramDRAFT_5055 [Paraburkholderia graminis C4D1M]MDQ0625792.1 hypothetical protein [Paraburkholderia graminis]CAB3708772.1 hypothetical protein R8871_04009 [Paraburkholderia graminis C4D1M]
MTTLNEYLVQKRAAWLAKREAARNDPDLKSNRLKARESHPIAPQHAAAPAQ